MLAHIREQTDKLFQTYKQGQHSVRELARINNIPFSTLRDRFRSRYGIDYTHYRAGEGTLHQVAKEALSNIPKHSRQYQKAKEWFLSQKENLIKLAKQSQDSHATRIYTSLRMNNDSIANCRLSCDLASSPFLGDSKYAPYLEEDNERIYLHN